MSKAFIFDWSGTLSNNFDSYCEIVNKIFKECGKGPITPIEIRATFTLPYMKFFNIHIPELTKEKQDVLYRKFLYQAPEASLYDGVSDVIALLSVSGWQMFVVSSDPLPRLTQEIQKSGFGDSFLKIIGDVHIKGDELVKIKEEFALNLDTTYYIGDTAGDVEAGQYAGMKTIGITWGFQNKEGLSRSNPDYIVDTIEEIKNLI